MELKHGAKPTGTEFQTLLQLKIWQLPLPFVKRKMECWLIRTLTYPLEKPRGVLFPNMIGTPVTHSPTTPFSWSKHWVSCRICRRMPRMLRPSREFIGVPQIPGITKTSWTFSGPVGYPIAPNRSLRTVFGYMINTTASLDRTG